MDESVTHGKCDVRSTIVRPAITFLIHCAYSRRDGQAELNSLAGNMPRRSPIPTLTVLDVE